MREHETCPGRRLSRAAQNALGARWSMHRADSWQLPYYRSETPELAVECALLQADLRQEAEVQTLSIERETRLNHLGCWSIMPRPLAMTPGRALTARAGMSIRKSICARLSC